MSINKTSYPLDNNHYFPDNFYKEVIVLGNTYSMDMKHFVEKVELVLKKR